MTRYPRSGANFGDAGRVRSGRRLTAGIIFHVWEKLKFHNVLWHVFVVAGSILHLWAIFDLMVLSRL